MNALASLILGFKPPPTRPALRKWVWVLLGAASWPAAADSVNLQGHVFTLPEGFTVECVASPPLVERPITAAFDEAGRLYVADSSGSNDPVQKQLETRPHRILRLEDSDGDGLFDRRTVFADQMMFPEGTLWHDGALYVSAPPSIWKLTDRDDDGVADQREEWHQGKTLTGCANDLHGPYLGPDGWIYWCKGAFAKQEHVQPDGQTFATRAAHIFRQHPDHRGVESVMTGGMDNPVDVVFTPGGERIFTTTFFQHPGGGQRDGLIHAIYGGVYGKQHDVLDDHPRTGGLMPVLTHLGPAAPCGLTRYESTAFGPDYQNNLFACLFNLQKITRHILVPDGATFLTKDEDFLVSDQRDFHPTDILEDADGSLLVVDTGGWYKICCPTSQLYKPDILGALYRIRRATSPPATDPRGLAIDWPTSSTAALIAALADDRPAVRAQAGTRLAKQGASVVDPLGDFLNKPSRAKGRLEAVWTLARIPGERARAVSRGAIEDADGNVGLAAIHAAALWRDREARGRLESVLVSNDSAKKRAAAEALGRLQESASVSVLLQAAGGLGAEQSPNSRRILEHSMTYALIELNDPEPTLIGLSSKNPTIQRVALMALDQMEAAPLEAAHALPLLAAHDRSLKETALWVARHHAEWASELAEWIQDQIGQSQSDARRLQDLVPLLASLASHSKVQSLLAETAKNREAAKPLRLMALEAMTDSKVAKTPEAWDAAWASIAEESDPDLLNHMLGAARAAPRAQEAASDPPETLLALARRQDLDADLRISALAVGSKPGKPIEDGLFQFLLTHLESTQPVTLRQSASKILAAAALSKSQLTLLIQYLPRTGPLELALLLNGFAQASDAELGSQLLQALSVAPGRTSLQPGLLRSNLGGFPDDIQRAGQDLLASLSLDEAGQSKHLEELLEGLPRGDIRRGQEAFNSTKAACSACHAIGYLGGKLGPDLTRIGQIRSERDLLEAILYPSRSFVRSFESVQIRTRDGEVHSGIVQRDAADELILATGLDTEVRIARSDIDEMLPGSVSVMPGGLEDVLTRQELSDLLVFLKATKW